MTTQYQHTQRGTVILASMVFSIVLLLAVCVWVGANVPSARAVLLPVAVVSAAILAGLGWYYSSMTVTVTGDELRWHFGPGREWIVPRADIERVRIAPHWWIGGYGMRWYGPGRWVYIVSGNRTVEVTLKSGGWRRLGTDDPEGLLRALTSNPAAAPSA